MSTQITEFHTHLRSTSEFHMFMMQHNDITDHLLREVLKDKLPPLSDFNEERKVLKGDATLIPKLGIKLYTESTEIADALRIALDQEILRIKMEIGADFVSINGLYGGSGSYFHLNYSYYEESSLHNKRKKLHDKMVALYNLSSFIKDEYMKFTNSAESELKSFKAEHIKNRISKLQAELKDIEDTK